MSIVRALARPMLAGVFVFGGYNVLRDPSAQITKAAPFIDKVAPMVGLPQDAELLVRANAAAMVGAGGLLAIGRMPRLSASVLAASLIPTTYAGHPFWDEPPGPTRNQQTIHFLKNLGLLGGVLLAAVGAAGDPN